MIRKNDEIRRSASVIAIGAGLVALLATITFSQASRPREFAREDGGLPATKVLDYIGVRPGMKVGEAGAGWGYFTFVLARRVGPNGFVYANDINEASLEELERHRRANGDTNIRTVMGGLDDPRFPVSELDFIVLVDAFHDFEKPVEWLVNLKKYVKPDARIAIIDVDPSKFPPDRPYNHAWPREKFVWIAAEAGYELVKADNDYRMHQVLVFRLPGLPAGGLD